VLYTLGALGYHRRWPNPAPKDFGFHEVLHTQGYASKVVLYWLRVLV
jgi:predicted membrane channel-forming protein YqfA (hemolysin III family)